MFHQRDYILRLIEQFGRVMRLLRDRILGRKTTTGETAEQVRKIAEEAGLDTQIALSLAPESLSVLVRFGGEVESGRCWLLAELLFLEGMQAKMDGDEARMGACFVRARTLLAMLPRDWSPSPEFPAVGERLAEIEGMFRTPDD